MADEQNVQGTGPTPGAEEKTFTQADVDRMIQARLDRERKKFPSDDELTAYRSWKDSQQTEQDRWNNLTKERDTAQAGLAAAQSELEALRREKYVLSKGLTGEEAEFIAFKAAKLVNDKTTFEQAVDTLAEEHKKKPTFDWTAQVGNNGNNNQNSANSAMNALIRGALK